MLNDTVHPCDLTPADVADWRALCAAAAPCASPLLGPDFTLRVGRFRPDALVTVWRGAAGQVVGVLPHHRRLGGLACPIGAPISDYHGPVAVAGFDFPEALAAAGLSAYRFSSAPHPSPCAPEAEIPSGGGFLIELDEGPEAYLEALRQARPKSFKNYRRLGHKLERDLGPLRLVASRDQGAFDQLLDWKRRQLARTGVYDFLRPAWLNGLLQDLFEDPNPRDGGLMLTLHAGDRLVGGHFGLRAGDVYHPWIASSDPDLGAWAPGHLFLMQAIAAMPQLGLRTYDLGPSHDHYKRPYARSGRPAAAGVCFAPSASATSRLTEDAWRVAGAEHRGLAQRVRRRLDVISMSEPTLLGRVQGYAQAVTAVRVRRPDPGA